jgi:hypothetical protein
MRRAELLPGPGPGSGRRVSFSEGIAQGPCRPEVALPRSGLTRAAGPPAIVGRPPEGFAGQAALECRGAQRAGWGKQIPVLPSQHL